MNNFKNERYRKVEEVYNKYFDVFEIANQLGYNVRLDASSARMRSPYSSNAHDGAICLYRATNSFCDFRNSNYTGDAVQLHYYLTTGGGILSTDSDDDEYSEYFLYKAKLCGIDLKPNKKNDAFKDVKKIEVTHRRVELKEVKESKRQGRDELNINNKLIYKYLDNKDKTLLIKHMMSRGLTFEEASKAPFVVSPNKDDVDNITALVNNYGTRAYGIPGFYRNENEQLGIKVYAKKSFMIPIVDINGRIASFHMRSFNKKSSYWALSSNGKEEGCSPGSPSGFWGDVKAKNENIILTEGAIKGWIIHLLTGLPVMYILGVSAQKDLYYALKEMKRRGLKHITTAFDMDYSTNKNVQEPVDKLFKEISAMGISFNTLKWNAGNTDTNQKGLYNGLDDYLIYMREVGKFEKARDWIIEYVNDREKDVK